MGSRPHPLHNITPAEIGRASQIVTSILQEGHGPSYAIYFKHIYLSESPKALLMPYLDAESEGVPAEQRPYVPRLAGVVYHTVDNPREFFEIIVSLDSETEVELRLPRKGQHSSFDRCV
jgi:primary-amine oxidase